MSKRAVAYLKPEDPSFLKKLKREAGYVEGPTLETKREHLPVDEDQQPLDDEAPVVVVLNPGDLTADQAQLEHLRRRQEEEEAKADLSQKIVFKSRKKREVDKEEPQHSKGGERRKKGERKEKKNCKQLLSFGDDEEEQD